MDLIAHYSYLSANGKIHDQFIRFDRQQLQLSTNNKVTLSRIYLNQFFQNKVVMDYQIITEDKFEEVINHLRQSFPDEPLNASVGLSIHGQPCPLLENYDLLTMKERMSVMAIDKITGTVSLCYFLLHYHILGQIFMN